MIPIDEHISHYNWEVWVFTFAYDRHGIISQAFK